MSARIGCSSCGKPVSTEVPEDTVVRAFIECPECIEKRAPKPPATSDDIVMRFRSLFAETWPLLNYPDFENDRERKSETVTMMLRATVEELIAHVGADAKRLTFIFGEEIGRAIAEHIRNQQLARN